MKRDGVKKYILKPILTKTQLEEKINTFLTPKDIPTILNQNADVYIQRLPDTEPVLLLRFRKRVLSTKKCAQFYENVIDFANETTNNRGNVNGVEDKGKKDVKDLPRLKTNIFGFFDEFPPRYKAKFREEGFSTKMGARPCSFNLTYPEKYSHTLPLIQEIDALYRKYAPEPYSKQRRKANQIGLFRIPGTAFTTVTTNVNYQTAVHADKGDDQEGFGNLVVLERGNYEGGETCFPEFGFGVNVREGDFLLMDVHQPHANLPIVGKNGDEEFTRLSVVCYLRENIWKNVHNKTAKEKKQWDANLRSFLRRTFKKHK
jgi:hypothetical protein